MEDNLLSETQSGFRKDYLTLDNIFILIILSLEYHKKQEVALSITLKHLITFGDLDYGVR